MATSTGPGATRVAPGTLGVSTSTGPTVTGRIPANVATRRLRDPRAHEGQGQSGLVLLAAESGGRPQCGSGRSPAVRHERMSERGPGATTTPKLR
jgi:hypothetical protein